MLLLWFINAKMETKTKIHHFKGGSFSHWAGSKEGDKSKANNYSRVLEETYNHVIFYTAFIYTYIYILLCVLTQKLASLCYSSNLAILKAWHIE